MERIFENTNKTVFLNKGIFTNVELLENCIKDVEKQLIERPEIIVFGKVCNQHRNVGFFSNESIGYKYSNKIMESKPLTESMIKLLDNINLIIGVDFNGILVNEYIDGRDYIGQHSDDETELNISDVVSISYGAERIFRVRDKETKNIVCDIKTEHCCILHMGGIFQKLLTHEIPIQKKVKNSRISFTFRKHNI